MPMPLHENIFLISDASYCTKSKVAGLATFDTSTGRKFSDSIICGSSREAEFTALAFSVKIALQNQYNNVVFVYDDMTLNIERIDQYITGKIQHYQFLWLKRSYLFEVDKLAKKARKVQESLGKVANQKLKLRMPGHQLQGKELLEAFKDRDPIAILRSSCVIADTKERRCLDLYMGNKNIASNVFEDVDYDFLNFIYHMLAAKDQPLFFQFLNIVITDGVIKNKICQPKKQTVYIQTVELIIRELKKVSSLKSKKEKHR
jgi:hypothetical protein